MPSDSGFDYTQRRYIPIGDETAARLSVREGDFFVSRGNGSLHLVGRGTLAQSPPGKIVFPDTMIRLRLVAAPSLNQLVGLIWQSRFVRRQVEKRARTTAGIYKILQRDIDSFVIPLPPSDEQIEILEAVSKQLCFIRRVEAIVEANLARAARLRQGILKRAFEGRLVPQDPTDEPAEQLLERIRQERTFTATNLSKNKTRSKHTTGQRSGRLFTKDTEPG